MTNEEVYRCAKETAEIIMSSAFAAYMADLDANKKRLQEAIKLHKSMHAIDGMIKAAQSETSLNISDPGIFDADPWLLGVTNGVLDLRTGRLLKAEPNQYITNQAGFPYDPAAQCPLWLKTLDEIFEGNAELVDLLQRLVGYSLTGDVNAEIFVYLDGPGGNGKSVVAKVMSSALGSYSCEVQTAAMTERDVNGTLFQRQLVKVIGKRAAWANETSKDDVFDDSAIKIMSSKDKIPARYLYREDFDYQPTHKLWIRGNHKPGVRDHSEAFWRRIVMIPFRKKFSGADNEKLDLHDVILKTEGPGVLAWAVRGCLAYRKAGRMVVPKCVLDMRKSYREDTDFLQQWIESSCKREGWMWLKEAHASYTQFLKDENFKAQPSSRKLARELDEKGYAVRKVNGKQKIYDLSFGSEPAKPQSEDAPF